MMRNKHTRIVTDKIARVGAGLLNLNPHHPAGSVVRRAASYYAPASSSYALATGLFCPGMHESRRHYFQKFQFKSDSSSTLTQSDDALKQLVRSIAEINRQINEIENSWDYFFRHDLVNFVFHAVPLCLIVCAIIIIIIMGRPPSLAMNFWMNVWLDRDPSLSVSSLESDFLIIIFSLTALIALTARLKMKLDIYNENFFSEQIKTLTNRLQQHLPQQLALAAQTIETLDFFIEKQHSIVQKIYHQDIAQRIYRSIPKNHKELSEFLEKNDGDRLNRMFSYVFAHTPKADTVKITKLYQEINLALYIRRTSRKIDAGQEGTTADHNSASAQPSGQAGNPHGIFSPEPKGEKRSSSSMVSTKDPQEKSDHTAPRQ